MGFLDRLKGMFGRSKDKATQVTGDDAKKTADAALDKGGTDDKSDAAKA